MKRVVITGIGVISPIANNVTDFWNGLTNGVCGIDFIKSFDASTVSAKLAAEVKDFNPNDYDIDKSLMRHSDLYAQYALAAASMAMKDCGLEVNAEGSNGIAPERLGSYIGSGVGGIQTFCNEHTVLMEMGPNRISPFFIPMMISNMAAANVAIAFHAQGPCLPVVTACATSTHAVGEAFLAVAMGRADAVITGGSEAAVCPMAIGGFCSCKALSKSTDPLEASIPFDARRNGFVLGEGSGVLILEEYEHAKARGAKIYAEVAGYGNTCDAHHYTAPHPSGEPQSRSIRQALDMAGYKGENLYINAHGTSTPLNDKSETLAIKLALGEEEATRAVISSNKSMIGHMLGAAGAVELAATALTLKNGVVPPTLGLTHPDLDCDLDYVPLTARQWQANMAVSNSFGFGGHNACVALRKI
ncbi:MAG: beta-ketoacyl-ACP synthase II [Bacteroidales bacterium]|nr:beta-ketoacyl-ACP synthase II [Bacteroidales bacterium]